MTHLLNTGGGRNWTIGSPPEGTDNPLIQRLESFGALSAADQSMILRHCASARTYPAQADIVREGETPDGILAILEGFACRHQYRHTGARQITAFLVAGDFCAWDAAVIGRIDYAVSTISPCRVARIPGEAFQGLTDPMSDLTRALRMNSLVHEATLREWLVNIGCRSALERIAHLFCELSVRLGAVGLNEGTTFELPLTQNDLAVTVGLSNVHVNRSLQALRRNRLIALKGRRLTILNWKALSDLAEFDPGYLRPARVQHG